jgi:hypothetical protein
MAKPPSRQFNDYAVEKGDGFVRRQVKILDAKTLAALRELESLHTWAQFVRVCEEQRRKRGW